MSVRLFLIADNAGSRWPGGGQKDKREIFSFITQSIIPGMEPSMLDNYLPESFPWCFVIPPEALRRRHYYIGAFTLLPGLQGKASIVALCACVSFKWMKQNLCSEYPITFWMARILNNIQKMDLTEKNILYLNQWIKALKRSMSPLWESFLLTDSFRFQNRSQLLLRECSESDYRISSNDGVDVMPWINWPNCTQRSARTWLWRQSRHLKILESQSIPLRRAKAERPDPSI